MEHFKLLQLQLTVINVCKTLEFLKFLTRWHKDWCHLWCQGCWGCQMSVSLASLILESHQSKEVRVDRRWPQWTLADWGYIFILYDVHNIQWTGHHGRHEAKGRFKGSHFKQKILIPISLGLEIIFYNYITQWTLLIETGETQFL